MRYYDPMIRSFRCSETEKLYNRLHSRKLPQGIQRVAMRKLWVLDAATDLNELRVPPSNRLEALRGDRKGQHSIRINQQWRVCFRWRAGDAYEVEIVDYH
jgi:proteic killer suppression protein